MVTHLAFVGYSESVVTPSTSVLSLGRVHTNIQRKPSGKCVHLEGRQVSLEMVTAKGLRIEH